jgi:TonB family protein
MFKSIVRNVPAALCVLLLCTSCILASQAPQQTAQTTREPIRVGGNVQESKLLYRVDPAYPPEARAPRVSGAVILQVTVNEQGLVSDVKVLRGHPLLDQSAVEAVKQWRYEPTLLNGEPVPVVATITVVFNVTADEVRLAVDDSGNLRDTTSQLEGPALLEKARGAKGGVLLTAGPKVPLLIIVEQIRAMQRQGIQNVRVQGYELREGRLFLPLPQDLQTPALALDRDHLAAMAKASGALDNLPPTERALLYRLFVTETGEIMAVEQRRGPRIPDLEKELMRTRVIAPGRRGADPVPMVVYVEIP